MSFPFRIRTGNLAVFRTSTLRRPGFRIADSPYNKPSENQTIARFPDTPYQKKIHELQIA
ncbi:MAG TPA: hypothetical protein DCX97_03035 [Alistipes sp.]|nr:hypothetical protein [Alistipes sp.]